MKKSLIAGFVPLAMIATPVLSVFAEDPPQVNGNETYYTHEAVVGEVDETVYSVDIIWDDMTFDWKYDAETNDFNFQPKDSCTGKVFPHESEFNGYKEGFGLYSDSTCETVADVYDGSSMYYYKEPGAGILVKDFTVNGRIKAEAHFTSEAKYMWVYGKFGSWSTMGSQEPEDEHMHYSRQFHEYDGDGVYRLSFNYDYGDYRQYVGNLVLEKGDTYDEETMRSGFVSSDDKIGNVVVTISPDYD